MTPIQAGFRPTTADVDNAVEQAIAQITPVIETAAWFGTENPVLEDGRLGVVSDTRVTKMGDGVTAWADLLEMDVAGKLLDQVSITETTPGHTALDDVVGLTGLIIPDYPFPTKLAAFGMLLYNSSASSGAVVVVMHGVTPVGGDRHMQQASQAGAGFGRLADIDIPLEAHRPGTCEVQLARLSPPNTGTAFIYADAATPASLSLYGA